jgi:hypothetical protein
MKYKLVLLATLVLSIAFAHGQSFEGEIIYSNHFTSKMKNFTDEQLEAMIGSKQEYLIKGGNYKSFLNGQSVTMQLYDYKTNRLYSRTPKSDTLYWFDASVNTDEVISYEIKNNAEQILGNNCDAIIMKTKTGTTTIFYTSRYKVDAKLYVNHNYGNWSFYTSKTGVLPLKTVMETNQFKMESTATEIKPLELGKEYFDIDSKAPIKKSL